MSVLSDQLVRGSLLQAWQESNPGTATAREQGGFVLRDADGSLSVERWPTGAKRQISVPPHPACRRGAATIVATFHTHPNTGPEFQQEPSLTDIRAVRDDPDLNDSDYEGEFVISSELVYRILRSGDFETIGETAVTLFD